MKSHKHSKNFLTVILINVILSLLITSCSSDEPENTQVNESISEEKTQEASESKPATPDRKSFVSVFDHPHTNVTDWQKHTFEHDFAEQCIKRELVNSNNKEIDRERFTKPCMCIAKIMMENLTAVEAEKFIDEKKNTQSLRIRHENAAYQCLIKKQQPKSPNLFGRK